VVFFVAVVDGACVFSSSPFFWVPLTFFDGGISTSESASIEWITFFEPEITSIVAGKKKEGIR
jgi:hypothetical protein